MAQVILPRDEQELVDCLIDRATRRQALEVIGGGSRLGVGIPVEADETLDLSHISGIVDYDPTELVLTALAGTTIREIDSLLSGKQQMLAFEPPSMGRLTQNPKALPTLGGSVASNSAGPRRILAGAARDHFLGFRAVSGRGEVFKSGGRVVKNVTGFDLSKLLAGSWGSLAVVTEISVKVMPKPHCGTTLAVSGLDIAAAGMMMAQSQALPYSVSAAAHLPGPVAERSPLASKASLTLVRLEGFSESVEARAQSLSNALGKFGEVNRLPAEIHDTIWATISEVADLLPGDGPVWRLSVAAGGAAHLAKTLDPARWLVDWGGGLIWYCNTIPIESPQVAHSQLWRGRSSTVPVSIPQIPAAHGLLYEALKSKFDPFRILNPRQLQADANAIY